MKRNLILFLLLALLGSTTLLAYDAKIDGIYYNFPTDSTATVTYQECIIDEYDDYHYYSDYTGAVVIPGSVYYNGTTYSVTSIDTHAFYECRGLTSITIPNSVTSIGFAAFLSCRGLTSVTIPNSVTSIGSCAFYACSDLTSINIPNSVTSIGSSTFYGCSSLTSINIPNSVTSIGEQAFYSCTSLTSVSIGSGVISIGEHAFSYCTGLTDVWCYAKSVPSTDSYAFFWFPFSSATLHVPAASVEAYSTTYPWSSFGTIVALSSPDIAFADANVKALCVANWDTDGDGELSKEEAAAVTDLGDIFKNKYITSFNELQYFTGLTEIEDYAFFNCNYLTSIVLPDGLTSIGNSAFAYCNNLTSIVLPDGITSIGQEAFDNCTSLMYITIPDGVTTIKYATFWHCFALASMNIPHNITTIENWAFYRCPISSLTIPRNVTAISNSAFAGCSDLISLEVEEGNTIYDSRNACNAIIETATNTLIIGCVNTVIPESITSIGDNAFYERKSLTSITLPDGISSIGERAFIGCSSLTSINIPIGVTSIGWATFSECSNLTSVTIPNSVISIGDAAFSGCTSLTSITIPNSVTSIGESAFRNCLGLTSVTIPNSVTSIGDSAFAGCNSLTSITIPNNVTSIGKRAFSWCTSLTDVYCYAENVPSTDSDVFYSSSISSATLHVPASSLETYSTTEPWSNFGTIVAIDDVANYRYYNLVVTGLQGGSTGHLQFSEFDLLNETLNEMEDLNVYAGSVGYTGENWPNITDNDVHTKFCGEFNGNAYFLFDAMSEVTPYGYRIYTAADTKNHPDRNPNSWKLYGSNTKLTNPADPNWVLIDERNNDMTMQATNYIPYDFYIRNVSNFLTMSKQSITLLPDEVYQLQVSDRFNTIQDLTLQWTSSNESVAIVNSDGLVMAIGPGTANITVTALEDNSLSATCAVTVVASLPAHRYYQFAIEAIGGGNTIQLSEFDLLDKNGDEITSLVTYYYTGSASNSNESQEKLFDNNIYTKYCGPFTAGKTIYIFIDAGKRVTLSGYRMTTADDTKQYPERNPTSWSLLGSDTKSEQPDDAVWTLLDHRENDNTLGSEIQAPYDFFFTYPSLSAIAFADANVKALCIANWDTNGDSELSYDEAAAVTDLGEAFRGKTNITSFNELQYFTSLTSIGTNAFRGCNKLASITIPGNVTSIGKSAFSSCTSLLSVSIPENVTSIGSDVFYNCSSLSCVNIPEGVTSIGNYMFFNCRALKTIIIPGNVASIGNYAFQDCINLSDITIPNSVTSIGGNAFKGCCSLIEIIIPENVTNIGNNAFQDCTGLKEIICNAEETPNVAATTFSGVDVSNIMLFVPENSLEQYQAHPVWGLFWIETPTGIEIMNDEQSTIYDDNIYNLNGQRMPALQKGINIIRYSDGTSKKVLVK